MPLDAAVVGGQDVQPAEVEGLQDVEGEVGLVEVLVVVIQFAAVEALVVDQVHDALVGEVVQEADLGTEAEATGVGVVLAEILAVGAFAIDVSGLPVVAAFEDQALDEGIVRQFDGARLAGEPVAEIEVVEHGSGFGGSGFRGDNGITGEGEAGHSAGECGGLQSDGLRFHGCVVRRGRPGRLGFPCGRAESSECDAGVTESLRDSPVTLAGMSFKYLARNGLWAKAGAEWGELSDEPVTETRWTFVTRMASMPPSVACGVQIHHHTMRNTIRFTAASLFAGALLAATAGAQTISIKGSDTLGAKLVPQLAESFKSKNGGVKFEIAAEGSSTAFPALANGTAQIGMSSRKAKPEEITAARAKGIKLKEVEACHDMIVVIVNKGNPLKALTKDQVAKIFTGQVKDWSEVGGAPGPISIYTRNTSSGTYKDWQTLAMKGRNYASGSQKLAGNEQIAQEVAKNKNGIGYVGLAYAKSSGVHDVTVDGVQPVASNAKKYAYSRACYYYIPENADATAKAFVEFATGGEGQKIAQRLGFVPN